MQTTIKRNVKDTLERQELVDGDLVTIDNSSDVIDVYILEKMYDNDTSTILALELSSAKDDVIVVRKEVKTDSLIHLDESFINRNGRLNKTRQLLVDGKIDQIMIFTS